MYPKVCSMLSPKSGRAVANQFVIYTPEGEVFQSYNATIAFKRKDGHIILDDTCWDYSRTTAKYRNLFLGESTQVTRNKIEIGEYELADLNQ